MVQQIKIMLVVGEWPSGKAPGFGPGIRGFESLLPSHRRFELNITILKRVTAEFIL